MKSYISGRMLTDYSTLENFSIVTYRGSEADYDEMYETLLSIRKSGIDFSAEIQCVRNGSSGHLFVSKTLIFLRTDAIGLLRNHLQGSVKTDYCTSFAYMLSPACIFRLAAGYAVNKVFCERDELAVGKIFMKAGKASASIFISPEIREITEPDGTLKPILVVPVYGTLYKKSSRPTKTHLNTAGVVVRGGNGISLKTVCKADGQNHKHAYVYAEELQKNGFMATKDYALKKIFDAMDEAGCRLRFELWEFESDPRFNFDEKYENGPQLKHEKERMKEILRQEKVRIEGPEYEKTFLYQGLTDALDKYYSLKPEAVYSKSGNLRLLVVHDKEHDTEKIYDKTKNLRTQHVTMEQIRGSKVFCAQMRACIRCLCVQDDLYRSRLTLIRNISFKIRTFFYGEIDGDIYSLDLLEDGEIRVRRCRKDACTAVRNYLRSMQADRFMALKDTDGHLYAVRETGQPAIPPVRTELSDYNNRCKVTKDKIRAMFNFSWTVKNGNFYYISGYSIKVNNSPRNYPHVYEIHPCGHSVLPEAEEVYRLVNVGFVRNDQESTVVPWGMKYLREYLGSKE